MGGTKKSVKNTRKRYRDGFVVATPGGGKDRGGGTFTGQFSRPREHPQCRQGVVDEQVNGRRIYLNLYPKDTTQRHIKNEVRGKNHARKKEQHKKRIVVGSWALLRMGQTKRGGKLCAGREVGGGKES